MTTPEQAAKSRATFERFSRSDGLVCSPWITGFPCRDKKCPDMNTRCPRMAPRNLPDSSGGCPSEVREALERPSGLQFLIRHRGTAVTLHDTATSEVAQYVERLESHITSSREEAERLRLFECLLACLTFDLQVDGRLCMATADFMRLLGEPRVHIVEAAEFLQAALSTATKEGEK